MTSYDDFIFPDDLDKPHCSDCKFLVGIAEEQRFEDNLLGGCGIDGHLISNNDRACKKYIKFK